MGIALYALLIFTQITNGGGSIQIQAISHQSAAIATHQLQPITAIVPKLFISIYLYSSFFIHPKEEHFKVSSLPINCNIN